MRQLGRGQSVVFVLPLEISTKIRERCARNLRKPIEVIHVLCWSILETWKDLKKSMPLWAVQGVRYEQQKPHWNGINTTQEQAKACLELEAQTLNDRYRPSVQDLDGSGKMKRWDASSNQNIVEIIKRCRTFGAMGSAMADMDEEQEVSCSTTLPLR
jgi:hypothetical protein